MEDLQIRETLVQCWDCRLAQTVAPAQGLADRWSAMAGWLEGLRCTECGGEVEILTINDKPV